ncbi:MAG: hypothetical protein ACRC46_11175 [Thermoguttaceae bacterium]
MNFVKTKLALFGRRLRRAAATDGVAAILTAATILAWCSFLADFTFGLPLGLRTTILIAATSMAAWWIRTRIVWLYVFPFSSRELAAAIERREPSLNGTLLTAVEHGQRDASSEFYNATVAHAIDVLQREPHATEVNRNVVLRRVIVMFALLVPTIFAAALQPATAKLWWSRNVLLSNRAWPNDTDIVVEGFGEDGICRIPRGEAFTLTVRTRDGRRRTPDKIQVQIGRERIVIDEFQVAKMSDHDVRIFTRTIPDVTESFDLVVSGGGVRRDGLRVEAVPRPQILDTEILVTPPAYLRQEPARISLTSGTAIVADGSDVTLVAKTSPRVRTVKVVKRTGTSGAISNAEHTFSANTLTANLGILRDTTAITINLEDEYAITSHPLVLTFTVRRDSSPQVVVKCVGVAASLTPDAVVPIEGNVTDDNAIENVTLCAKAIRLANAEENSATEEIVSRNLVADCGRAAYTISSSFAVESLQLREGDTLSLWVDATDNERLDTTTGQLGRSEVFTFKVVSRETLLATLETQEIVLRQRLDGAIHEVETTRDVAMSTDVPDTIRTQLVRDAQRQRYEMETIATSLEEMRRQRENNRVLDATSRERLAGIVSPLRELAEDTIPAAEKTFRESPLNDAAAKLDEIASTMREVRDKMLELESYGELLERFRELIRNQQDLRDATKREHSDALRRLTE